MFLRSNYKVIIKIKETEFLILIKESAYTLQLRMLLKNCLQNKPPLSK